MLFKISKKKERKLLCYQITPLEANLGWICKLKTDFIGRDALVAQKAEGLTRKIAGFEMRGRNSLREISRDVAALVSATLGPSHQYPDGLVLFTGTMFAPTQDRDGPGEGFTHHVGDIVRISCPELGGLVNRVGLSEQVEPWTFGTSALMRNLAARGLLG